MIDEVSLTLDKRARGDYVPHTTKLDPGELAAERGAVVPHPASPNCDIMLEGPLPSRHRTAITGYRRLDSNPLLAPRWTTRSHWNYWSGAPAFEELLNGASPDEALNVPNRAISLNCPPQFVNLLGQGGKRKQAGNNSKIRDNSKKQC